MLFLNSKSISNSNSNSRCSSSHSNVKLIILLILSCILLFSNANEDNHEYQFGEEVTLWYNYIGPYRNPSIQYSYDSLPWCLKVNGNSKKALSIFDSLMGNELIDSRLPILFGKTVPEHIVCNTTKLKKDDIDKYVKAISQDYINRMYIDGLPIFSKIGELSNHKRDVPTPTTIYNEYYIFTHKKLVILHNNNKIVSADLIPDKAKPLNIGDVLTFTYSVEWHSTIETFEDRFRIYNLDPEDNIKFISIINEGVVFVFLGIPFSLILMKTLGGNNSNGSIINSSSSKSSNNNSSSLKNKHQFSRKEKEDDDNNNNEDENSILVNSFNSNDEIESDTSNLITSTSDSNETTLNFISTASTGTSSNSATNNNIINNSSNDKDKDKFNLASTVNEICSEVFGKDQTGWRVIQSDVNRAPAQLVWLSSLIGIGMQLFSLFCIVVLSTMLSLNYGNKGSGLGHNNIFNAVCLLFPLASALGGMITGGFIAKQPSLNWLRACGFYVTLLPTFIFSVFIVLRIFSTNDDSLTVLSLYHLLRTLILVCLIAQPCAAAGFYGGYRWRLFSWISSTSSSKHLTTIARPVPANSAKYRTLMILVGGILPYIVIHLTTEMSLSSLYAYKHFNVFTLYTLVEFIVFIIALIFTSVIVTYITLNAEDHRWHWISFLSSASISIYILLHSIIYFYTKTEISGLMQTCYYFIFSLIVSLAVGIMSGSIGFVTSSVYIQSIYHYVKID